MATPVGSGPDEVAHLVKAAAVARREWTGLPHQRLSQAKTLVRVPQVYLDVENELCFKHQPDLPAGCATTRASGRRIVKAITYVGRYPPLYYAAVGLPTFLATRNSIYLMRLLGALMNAAMLGLAFAAAYRWSRSPLLLAGLAVAVTPMAIFLSSVINPSGLEITAAIAMWTTATVLVVDHPKRPPTLLLAAIAVPVAVMVSTRPSALLWPLLCAVVLLPIAWKRLDLRALVRRHDVWLCGGLALAAALATIVWVLRMHGIGVMPQGVPSAGTAPVTIARAVVGQDRSLLLQYIGVFGWVDTPVPLFTEVVWLGLVGALVLIAVALAASRRMLASVVLALAVAVAVPSIASYLGAHHVGLIAQGRYYLPLVAGLPIVAAAASTTVGSTALHERRVLVTIIVAAATAQAVAAIWTLRRYAVGIDGPLWPATRVANGWQPPIPAPVLDVLFILGWVALAAVLLYLSRRTPLDDDVHGALAADSPELVTAPR
jgi:hypothetical protein